MTAAELADKIRDPMRDAKESGFDRGRELVPGENYAEIEPDDELA